MDLDCRIMTPAPEIKTCLEDMVGGPCRPPSWPSRRHVCREDASDRVHCAGLQHLMWLRISLAGMSVHHHQLDVSGGVAAPGLFAGARSFPCGMHRVPGNTASTMYITSPTSSASLSTGRNRKRSKFCGVQDALSVDCSHELAQDRTDTYSGPK